MTIGSLEKNQKIRKVFDRNSVSFAVLFGSRAKKNFHKDSDYDFLIKFQPQKKYTLFDIMSVREDLEKELRKDVDVVTFGSINPKMKKEILSSSIPIYDQRKPELKKVISDMLEEL